MAQSDLVTKRSIMKVIENLFKKYKMAFKPGGDEDIFGFCAEMPQSIEDMPPEYDVESVVKAIQDGQSLNIPHQGYCMNKDIAIEIIRSGSNINTSYEKSSEISDDTDRAIMFFSMNSFCEPDCAGRNCITCNRYKAKKNALISLNFYRKIEDMLTRITYLKENSKSTTESGCYREVEKMIQEAYNYANDRTNLC